MSKVLLVGLFVFYAVLTAQRVPVWHDNLSLWTDAARIAPNEPRVHYNLMEAHRAVGNQVGVDAEWQRLIETAMAR